MAASSMRLFRMCSWKSCINLKSSFHLQPCIEFSRSSFHSASVLFVSAPLPNNGIDHLGKTYGPAVRLLLLLYNLEPSAISASGPHGKLLKCDVINYITVNKLMPAISSVQPIEGPLMREFQRSQLADIPVLKDSQKLKLAPKSKTAFEDIPISSLRQSHAKRILESKFNVPHSYGNVECNIGSLEKLIKLKKDDGVEISIHDFIVKAVAVVLNNVPSVNVRWVNSAVEQLHRVDLSVSMSSNNGIVSQIIERANMVAVEDISHKINELVESTKGSEIKPDGNNNGTFTILIQHEVADVPYLTSVICPPQCAVLAVGSSKRILNENGSWNSHVSLTLSYDRRAIEDTSACEFLHQLVSIVENPAHGFIKFPFSDDLM